MDQFQRTYYNRNKSWQDEAVQKSREDLPIITLPIYYKKNFKKVKKAIDVERTMSWKNKLDIKKKPQNK